MSIKSPLVQIGEKILTAAVPATEGPHAAKHMAINMPAPHTNMTLILWPKKSMKTPRTGTRKNPMYCAAAVYHPAVMASTSKRR